MQYIIKTELIIILHMDNIQLTTHNFSHPTKEGERLVGEIQLQHQEPQAWMHDRSQRYNGHSWCSPGGHSSHSSTQDLLQLTAGVDSS